jgi:hypothetical protein
MCAARGEAGGATPGWPVTAASNHYSSVSEVCDLASLPQRSCIISPASAGEAQRGTERDRRIRGNVKGDRTQFPRSETMLRTLHSLEMTLSAISVH